MARGQKDFILLIDTETTITDKVVDFGAIVVDRKGEIHSYCDRLIMPYYNDREGNPLFFNESIGGLWAKRSLDKRYAKYDAMLDKGIRSLASVNAVNRWLENVKGKYNPILTAYNLAFDKNKCYNTDIDLNIFAQEFCLMKASQDKWMTKKPYLKFILENHYFNNRTKLGNLSFSYKAEIMARFVTNSPDMEDEPHTALEDARDYELPILLKLINSTKREKWLNPTGLSWQKTQVRDFFSVK